MGRQGGAEGQAGGKVIGLAAAVKGEDCEGCEGCGGMNGGHTSTPLEVGVTLPPSGGVCACGI